MPNPPKPLELRRKLGNPGKGPMPKDGTLVALPAARGVPEPLRPLGAEGRKLWERIWTSGALWLAATTDAELVMIVCESMDERQILRVRIMNADGAWVRSGGTEPGADRLDRVALRQLDAQVVAGLASLGFDPLNRSRLGVAEVKQVTALEELAARRASGANRVAVTVETDA